MNRTPPFDSPVRASRKVLVAICLVGSVGCGSAGPDPAAPAASVALGSPETPTDTTADSTEGEDTDPASPSPTARKPGGDRDLTQRKATAKKAYKKGRAEQEAGHYREAIVLFQLADRAFPGAAPRYEIARCFDALGDFAEARRYYEAFLASAPANKPSYADRIEHAQRRIDELKAKPSSP